MEYLLTADLTPGIIIAVSAYVFAKIHKSYWHHFEKKYTPKYHRRIFRNEVFLIIGLYFILPFDIVSFALLGWLLSVLYQSYVIDDLAKIK